MGHYHANRVRFGAHAFAFAKLMTGSTQHGRRRVFKQVVIVIYF